MSDTPQQNEAIVMAGYSAAIIAGVESRFTVERLTSGVVVTALEPAHDPATQPVIVGIAYCALPDSTSVLAANAEPLAHADERHRPEWLYVDQALPALFESLQAKGYSLPELRWFVVGGAQPFTFGGGNNTLNIGSRNIQAALTVLAQHGLASSGQVVGSNKARTIHIQPLGVTVKHLGGDDVFLQ